MKSFRLAAALTAAIFTAGMLPALSASAVMYPSPSAILPDLDAFGYDISTEITEDGTTTTAEPAAAETIVSSTTVTTPEPTPTGIHCTTVSADVTDGSAVTTTAVSGAYTGTTCTSATVFDYDYRAVLEYDDSPMQVGESREIRVCHPTGQAVHDVNVYEVSDNISYAYEPGSDIITITALAEGSAQMYIMAEGCAFGQYLFIDVTGAADGTATTAEPAAAETIVSSTTVTTPEPTPTGIHCTTTLLMYDCPTLLDYDDTPMQAGESREVRVYHPAGQIVRNVSVYKVSDNISYDYEPGSDIITITALAEGKAEMFIVAEGCAFGELLYLDVIGAATAGESVSENTTTTTGFAATESTTTTTTAAVNAEYDGSESLPQTGMRIPYLQIFLAASAAWTGGAMLCASGVMRRKREVQ